MIPGAVTEKVEEEPKQSGGPGLSLARLAKFALVALALGIAALVAVALLNPQPEKHRVDYGGFQQ